MNFISTAIAVIGLLRQLWGLYKDIRKADTSFQLGLWATRYRDANRAVRESETKDLAELRAFNLVLGEKVQNLKSSVNLS